MSWNPGAGLPVLLLFLYWAARAWWNRRRAQKQISVSPRAPGDGWRVSPFKVGHRYRVCCDFAALHDRFHAGEVLVYRSTDFVPYDGLTSYRFALENASATRTWEVPDEADLSGWQDLFQELPEKA